MKTNRRVNRILVYESLGFLLVIAMSWLDELLNLPGLLFGGSGNEADWREGAMESAVAIVVWVVVVYLTRRLLLRLRYMEGFLRMCASCRRVDHEGQWVPVEVFFDRKLDVRTTHGLCPECARKIIETLP
jgi:hypothetical protein